MNSSLQSAETAAGRTESPRILLLSLPIIKKSCLCGEIPVTPVGINDKSPLKGILIWKLPAHTIPLGAVVWGCLRDSWRGHK